MRQLRPRYRCLGGMRFVGGSVLQGCRMFVYHGALDVAGCGVKWGGEPSCVSVGLVTVRLMECGRSREQVGIG